MYRRIFSRFKFTTFLFRPKTITSIVKSVLLMFIGYWFGCFWKNNGHNSNSLPIKYQPPTLTASAFSTSHLESVTNVKNCSSWFECSRPVSVNNYLAEAPNVQGRKSETPNLINIGFITDGNNIVEIDRALKTLFLHRQSFDFLAFHIVAPKTHWSLIGGTLAEWYKVENGLANSFNYTLYDSVQCTEIENVFKPYFDTVYRAAFCKLAFPYLLDPARVPYLLLLDFDILILNNRFTSDCWLKTITKLERHPLALFSIAHQGSPKTKQLPFPMPYLYEYKAHFHFNNGVILFHVARIHALDSFLEHDVSISAAYPVASGPRRWLRDFEQISLGYLNSCQAKHSLTQVLWNVYMVHRAHSFVQLNQACNFQACAQWTHVHMWDDYTHYPNIIIGHLWRVCKKKEITTRNFFNSYFQALAFLPLSYINRINPTELIIIYN